MEGIYEFLKEIGWQDRLVGLGRIVLILIVAAAARIALRKAMERLEERLLRRSSPDDTPTESSKRVSTIMKLVRQSVSITFWGTVSLVVLGELGWT